MRKNCFSYKRIDSKQIKEKVPFGAVSESTIFTCPTNETLEVFTEKHCQMFKGDRLISKLKNNYITLTNYIN